MKDEKIENDIDDNDCPDCLVRLCSIEGYYYCPTCGWSPDWGYLPKNVRNEKNRNEKHP